MQALHPDWVIVDHYALDIEWELALRPHCTRLMVIDDLANRQHDCDLLLDQNLGRSYNDYDGLIPPSCSVMVGPQYALLRPEFAALRPYSLQRRAVPVLKRILVSMGGVDKDNVTGKVLEALAGCPLPDDCHITVVMGPHAPWLTQVQNLAAKLPWPTEVLAGVDNMAQIMADSDVAIGAAGSTAWERCCLGLPSLVVVLAENQRFIASALHEADAAYSCNCCCLPSLVDNFCHFIDSHIGGSSRLHVAVVRAASVTSGDGVSRVLKILLF